MVFRKKKVTEQALRDIVRWCYPKGIEWVEPAFGSTPGLPDVNIDIGNGISIPVELKMWQHNKRGHLVAEMRPAQIRYHIMGARKGKRSALLYSVPMGLTPTVLELYLLNGKYAPKDKLEHDVAKRAVQVGDTTHLHGSIRYFINKILNSTEFWA